MNFVSFEFDERISARTRIRSRVLDILRVYSGIIIIIIMSYSRKGNIFETESGDFINEKNKNLWIQRSSKLYSHPCECIRIFLVF